MPVHRMPNKPGSRCTLGYISSQLDCHLSSSDRDPSGSFSFCSSSFLGFVFFSFPSSIFLMLDTQLHLPSQKKNVHPSLAQTQLLEVRLEYPSLWINNHKQDSNSNGIYSCLGKWAMWQYDNVRPLLRRIVIRAIILSNWRIDVPV